MTTTESNRSYYEVQTAAGEAVKGYPSHRTMEACSHAMHISGRVVATASGETTADYSRKAATR